VYDARILESGKACASVLLSSTSLARWTDVLCIIVERRSLRRILIPITRVTLIYIGSLRTLLLLQACPQPAMHMSRLCDKRSLQSPVTQSKHVHGRLVPLLHPHWHRHSRTVPLTCLETKKPTCCLYPLLVPLAGTPCGTPYNELPLTVKPNEAYIVRGTPKGYLRGTYPRM